MSGADGHEPHLEHRLRPAVDIMSVPYDELSEAASSPQLTTRPLSITLESPTSSYLDGLRPASQGKQKAKTANSARRNSIWDSPPLFKAYPQALLHATLPATTSPADTVVRLHEKGAGASLHRLAASSFNGAVDGGEAGLERGAGRTKMTHHRDASSSSLHFEWTSKIYILTASGNLLQYASEGPFNRCPEKVLRLCKSSAAFVSDIIPGRHWVLQVSATTEPHGVVASDSRSLLSKLTFRPVERRRASNFLMVFECAEDMEDWLSTLRHEIELLGGKRQLSETGRPRVEEEDGLQLREQPSQRTLVVKDSSRLSRTMPDSSWEDELDFPQGSDGAMTVTDADTIHDHSLDDLSATNSVISQDGQQLDALRDSSNRFSFVSSGQRTFVTSAGSSPATSPTLDTFPTHLDEGLPEPEARLRPNAHAIVDRRRSMQTMSPYVDRSSAGGLVGPMRPLSYNPSASWSENLAPLGGAETDMAGASSPSNFRLPYMRMPCTDTGSSVSQLAESDAARPKASLRKAPPPSLRQARPLSMVADQPSPQESTPERPASRMQPSSRTSRGSMVEAAQSVSRGPGPSTLAKFPVWRSSLTFEGAHGPSPRANPRRLSTMNAVRSQGGVVAEIEGTSPFLGSLAETPSLGVRESRPRPGRPIRWRSTTNLREDARRLSPALKGMPKCASVMTESAAGPRLGGEWFEQPPPPLRGPPPSSPLPPLPPPAARSSPSLRHSRLGPDASSRASLYRKSMPQLTDGPPPAPPPRRGLPPVPRRPHHVTNPYPEMI